MLEFVRPYTPDLVGWLRDFGQGAATYDANGHYARIQPIFNAFQFSDNAAGGVLNAIPPEQRFDGAADRRAQALPGRGQPAGRGRVLAVSSGNLDCDPTRCRRDHEADRRHRRRARRARGAGVRGRPRDRDAQPYKVRAIFDNAGFVIPGEDVKVAGVKVGKVDSLDVTPDYKAAVVLRIDRPGYRDFRRDASCIVRPQSLIGEKFVECKPTQKRAVGTRAAAAAAQDRRAGRARASTSCRSTNTVQTVDIDLIGNTHAACPTASACR